MNFFFSDFFLFKRTKSSLCSLQGSVLQRKGVNLVVNLHSPERSASKRKQRLMEALKADVVVS